MFYLTLVDLDALLGSLLLFCADFLESFVGLILFSVCFSDLVVFVSIVSGFCMSFPFSMVFGSCI